MHKQLGHRYTDKLLVVSKCMNINTRITLANNKHACTYICSSQQLTSVMMKAIHVTLITVNGCVNNIRSGIKSIHRFTQLHACTSCCQYSWLGRAIKN